MQEDKSEENAVTDSFFVKSVDLPPNLCIISTGDECDAVCFVIDKIARLEFFGEDKA